MASLLIWSLTIDDIMSPLTASAKLNFFRIIPFGLIWLVFGIVYSLLERGLLGELHYYPSTGNPYNFSKAIFITSVLALVLGLLIGTIEILYLHKSFLRDSFIRKLLFKTAIYALIIILFLLVITATYNSFELKTNVLDKSVWKNVGIFFSNFAFWSVELYIASIIGVTLFYTEVSENMGRGVLNNFLTGKYHTPKEEKRIFMFLDMKSSTTIAEKLGHVRYFEMLREYFSDLTEAIIIHSGEIYQYVGDEMVVSWTLKTGLSNNNCIQCFFSMKEKMKTQKEKYDKKFGIRPEFKAGFHFGNVITGEIGVIQKDIIFTGDVLNTAARIQGLCNLYEVDILISGQLMEKLQPPFPFTIEALGESELRGRDEKITLYSARISPLS